MNVSVVPDSSTVVDPSVSATVNPATSSSVVDTETVWSATPSKLLSELASLMEMVVVEETVPSMRSSSAPVTVTVWAVSQFADVKVRGLLTDDSEISLELMAITTSDVG